MLTLPLGVPGGKRLDVVGLGENSSDHLCVVPRHPTAGDKVRVDHYALQGGGQIATAMVACRRLGLSARYLGKVGDDAAGRIALADLEREGVDTSGVRVEPGLASRMAFVLVDGASGTRTVVWHGDERLGLRPEELRSEEITEARALLVDMTAPRAALQAARWARAARVLVAIDADQVGPGLEEILPLVDLCIVSAELPPALTGERDPERALRAMRRWNPDGLLCVTQGAGGALALEGERALQAPAFRVDVVDTTGCGDVFHAAFLYGVLAGWDLERTLRFSNAAAAIKTRALGARPGVPTLGEVEAFLGGRGG